MQLQSQWIFKRSMKCFKTQSSFNVYLEICTLFLSSEWAMMRNLRPDFKISSSFH